MEVPCRFAFLQLLFSHFQLPVEENSEKDTKSALRQFLQILRGRRDSYTGLKA